MTHTERGSARMASIVTSVRFPEDQLARLKEIADWERRTLTQTSHICAERLLAAAPKTLNWRAVPVSASTVAATVRLPEDLLLALKAFAAREHRTLTQVLNLAAQLYIESESYGPVRRAAPKPVPK